MITASVERIQMYMMVPDIVKYVEYAEKRTPPPPFPSFSHNSLHYSIKVYSFILFLRL